jgi:hypothetical protein
VDKIYHQVMKMKIREITQEVVINKINKIDKTIYKTTDEGRILTVIFQIQKLHKMRGFNIFKIKMLRP